MIQPTTATEPSLIAISPERYTALIEAEQELIYANMTIEQRGESIDKLITESLQAAIKFQDELSKRDAKFLVLYGLMVPFLQDFEARFDKGDDGISPELADDYLRAARFQKALGRTDDRIEEVQEWVNNYLPFGN